MHITRSLLVSDGLLDVLEEAPKILLRLIPSANCSIYLHDPQTSDFYCYHSAVETIEPLLKKTQRKGEGLVGWASKLKQSAIVNNPDGDSRFGPSFEYGLGFNPRNFMIYPMFSEHLLVGVLCLLNKENGMSYDAEDQKTMEVVGDLMSVAIQQAGLREKQVHSERLASIGMAVSGILHDMKNPLTTIKGFIQLLEKAGGANGKYCGIILDEVSYMTNLLEDWLDLSRGTLVIQNKRIKLNDVLERHCRYLEAVAEQEGFTLAKDFQYDGSARVDGKKLMRALHNLTSNARRAMRKNDSLTIASRQEDRALKIVVRDTGIGIPPEVQEHLFKPFYTSDKKKGTGLGLVITRNIISAHGGEITYTSELNKGTEFVITLPMS